MRLEASHSTAAFIALWLWLEWMGASAKHHWNRCIRHLWKWASFYWDKEENGDRWRLRGARQKLSLSILAYIYIYTFNFIIASKSLWEPVHCHNPKLTINLTCRCTNSEGQAGIAAWFGRQINTTTYIVKPILILSKVTLSNWSGDSLVPHLRNHLRGENEWHDAVISPNF